jgi:hypothetical protein
MADAAFPPNVQPAAEADDWRQPPVSPGERRGDDPVRRFLSGSLVSRAEARALDASGQLLRPSELTRGGLAKSWRCRPRFISTIFPRPRPPQPEPPRPPAPPPDREVR